MRRCGPGEIAVKQESVEGGVLKMRVARGDRKGFLMLEKIHTIT